MKGYIYPMFAGADPEYGWELNDPIFGRVPTLGACMPNIRKLVEEDDYIFAISGRVEGAKQYVVGGFQVAEKISALAAYGRFPELRQRKRIDGGLSGNIIITETGEQSATDYHNNFKKRIDNYIVGKNPVVVDGNRAIARARAETLDVMNEVFRVKAKRLSDVTARWRRLDEGQIERLVDWLQSLAVRGP